MPSLSVHILCPYTNLIRSHAAQFYSFIDQNPSRSQLFPYTTLFRSFVGVAVALAGQFAGSASAYVVATRKRSRRTRSEEHTSELQSQFHLVCRLLLEKKKLDRSEERFRRNSDTELVCCLILEETNQA